MRRGSVFSIGSLSINDGTSIKNMFFGEPGSRRFSQDLISIPNFPNENFPHGNFSQESDAEQNEKEKQESDAEQNEKEKQESDAEQNEKEKQEEEIGKDETMKVMLFQVFVPFLIAGYSNVAIGLILAQVQNWQVFKSIPELFLLIASFMGFKGNLEMTLAARLATQANTGQLDKPKDQVEIAVGNIALIQSQSIIVAFLCTIIAMIVNWIKDTDAHAHTTTSCLLMTATALVTASLSGLFLTILMVTVTIISRRIGINPDNVSTLLTAILGDATAGILLAYTAHLFYQYRSLSWLAPGVIAIFPPILIGCMIHARKNPFTRSVIYQGWIPILIAMVISSIAGLIFDLSVERFENIAIFLPIINGVGSNLVAVQTSRLSTYFHQRCTLGTLDEKHSFCSNPVNAFIGSDPNVRTARFLLIMSLSGHIIYLVTIRLISGGDVFITPIFLILYLIASLVQVLILLYLAHITVPFLWSKSIDPDTGLIPGIMACGDFLGTILLTTAYFLLERIADPNAVTKFHIIAD